MPEFVAMALLLISMVGLALPLAAYPTALWLVGGGQSVAPPCPSGPPPTVTLIVAFHGGDVLLMRKLANFGELDYPPDRLNLILASDGPLTAFDQTKIADAADPRITVFALPESMGKAHVLNHCIGQATGDVIVFSDLDAVLAPDAIRKLVRWFGMPDVGGICGLREFDWNLGIVGAGQASYVSADSRIKLMENRLGAITSNDGKLYAIRRSLFEPVDPTATDDLYCSLSVIAKGHRFLFDPDARVKIVPPSWSLQHDLERRRRIVVCSLSGIFARPRLLLATEFGLFGARLIVNKVLRRLAPVFFLGVLLGSALLAQSHLWAAGLLAIQVVLYLAAATLATLTHRLDAKYLHPLLAQASQGTFYFCMSMTGMLLGLFDYASGKRISRWQPKKTG